MADNYLFSMNSNENWTSSLSYSSKNFSGRHCANTENHTLHAFIHLLYCLRAKGIKPKEKNLTCTLQCCCFSKARKLIKMS